LVEEMALWYIQELGIPEAMRQEILHRRSPYWFKVDCSMVGTRSSNRNAPPSLRKYIRNTGDTRIKNSIYSKLVSILESEGVKAWPNYLRYNNVTGELDDRGLVKFSFKTPN
jgi:hypothetical protein